MDYLAKNGFFAEKRLVSDFFICGFLFKLYGIDYGFNRGFACLMWNQLIYALTVVCTISLRTLHIYRSMRMLRMRCPYCNSDNSKTLETRDSPENTTRRRKECINCSKRYTTYEYLETVELMVRKKDGELQRFDVNKIIRGLQKACEKRPITMTQINELAGQVRQDLMLKGTEEVASEEIGDSIMKYLKNLDRIAYIRFASVYKQFEEPEDFRRLLLEVKKWSLY